eukprot:GHVP01059170.1.p1 GENE.GHVP01059170.1~~GHVP01059170.1.p1  ORF type:complete len:503 (+),score=61.62 GHVP01059170.1:12-1520(+)
MFFQDLLTGNILQNTWFLFSKQNKKEYASVPEEGIVSGQSILPDISEKTLKKYYPPSLKLISLTLIHRHGHRTPLSTLLESSFSHFRWDLCKRVGSDLIKRLQNKNRYSESEQHTPAHPQHEKERRFQNLYKIVLDNTKDSSRNKNIELGAGNTRQKEVQFDLLSPEDSCYMGQLTDYGYELMHTLGRRFRALYVNNLGFLPQKFSDNDIYLRSSEYARTIESLQAVVNGMYPFRVTAPLINIRKPEDETLCMVDECARYQQLESKHKEEITKKNKHLLHKFKRRVMNSLGLEKLEGSIERIWDVLVCRYTHQQPLPSGITPLLMKKMERLAVQFAFGAHKKNKELFMLTSGRLIGEISSNIRQAVHADSMNTTKSTSGPFAFFRKSNKLSIFSSTVPKLTILSGHDSTITPLVFGLGIDDKHWPCFGSNLTFELFSECNKRNSDGKEYYVRLKYNDQFVTLPEAIKSTHPKDKSLCKLDSFLSICDKYTPKDYKKMCEVSN